MVQCMYMKWVAKKAGNVGMTVVEMLVVITVIAILAALVFVSYRTVQDRTYNSTVQSDLASNIKTLTVYYSKYGIFPTEAQLASMTPKLGFATSNYSTALNAVLYCRSVDGTIASMIGASKTGKVYYVTNSARTPVELTVAYSQTMATSCTNTGVNDPSNGTSGGWIHTTATGWDTWVK